MQLTKLDENWIEATDGNLSAVAKVYATAGSAETMTTDSGQFISKLAIRDDGVEVYHFDRGLDYDSTETLAQKGFLRRLPEEL